MGFVPAFFVRLILLESPANCAVNMHLTKGWESSDETTQPELAKDAAYVVSFVFMWISEPAI